MKDVLGELVDADHGEGPSTDTHAVAQRVDPSEQLIRCLAFQDDDGGAASLFGERERPPRDDLPAQDLHEPIIRAVDGGELRANLGIAQTFEQPDPDFGVVNLG